MAGHPGKVQAPGGRHWVGPRAGEAGRSLVSSNGTQVGKKSSSKGMLRL